MATSSRSKTRERTGPVQFSEWARGNEEAESWREWEDPRCFGLGKEEPHATLFAAESEALALGGEREASSRFVSLNGRWHFHWSARPSERPHPASYTSDHFDDSGWGYIDVPANWVRPLFFFPLFFFAPLSPPSRPFRRPIVACAAMWVCVVCPRQCGGAANSAEAPPTVWRRHQLLVMPHRSLVYRLFLSLFSLSLSGALWTRLPHLYQRGLHLQARAAEDYIQGRAPWSRLQSDGRLP